MAYNPGDTLVRAVMSPASGLPEDQVINDFAFGWLGGGSPLVTDYVALMGAVDQFYNATQASGNSVGKYISSFVNRSATHELQCYAITTGPMGSPVATIPWLGPVTPEFTSGLPTEVAAVLSFHADLTGLPEESGVTRPRARRRGRVYIGPLVSSSSVISSAAPPFLLASALTTAMREAAVKLKADALLVNWEWSVWSRAGVNLYPIVGGWTDNAPDTQRRRGPDPTARVTYTV